MYGINNPVLYVDENGNWVHMALGAGIGFLAGGVLSVATQYFVSGQIDWGRALISAGSGAVSGALAATGIGLFGQIVGNAALGAASDFGDQLYVNQGDITKINIEDIMISTF